VFILKYWIEFYNYEIFFLHCEWHVKLYFLYTVEFGCNCYLAQEAGWLEPDGTRCWRWWIRCGGMFMYFWVFTFNVKKRKLPAGHVQFLHFYNNCINTSRRRKMFLARELLSRRGLDPIKLAYNNPVNRQSWSQTDRYAELAVSSRVATKIIASTHCTYHGGMARLRGTENTGMMDSPKVVTHPTTNRARRSLTLLMWSTPSSVRQTRQHIR